MRRWSQRSKARRRVEDRLADTQQSLAVTLASIDAGFIATDREGRVTRMNSVSERLTGWPEAQACGQDLWQVYVREGRPTDHLGRNPVDLMQELAVTVDTAHHVVVLGRDGRRTPVEIKAALTHDTEGSVRGMAIVLRDTSQWEQDRIESNRLAAIVASSHDAIIGKTLQGRITSWNGAAETLFGYRAEEAIGQPVQMLIPDDRLDEEMTILARLARGELVPAFETRRVTRSGQIVDVSISVSPIRDAVGRVAGASKIVRDITQRKLTETARQRAEMLERENHSIQAASRVKSQFLANMSHELRTPLNAVIGFADLLLTGKVDPASPKYRLFLGHIAGSGRHLLTLINDVLDLSKVEAGKLDFIPEPLDLPALVADTAAILHIAAERKHITLVADIDPSLTDLFLDGARLKQALYNYLSNAIKFTPALGRVTMRAVPQGQHHFRLEVEDTGIGIAAADLPKLFSEFRQLDAGVGKAHEGTGLGLALTRRLVEAQGGSVGARSEPGRGSVFHLMLNRHHGHDAVVTPIAHMDAALHLLVVEHDAQLSAALSTGLTDAGFQVETALTAGAAMSLARSRLPQALTLDLALPDQPGLGLLSALRDGARAGHAPAVGMSLRADNGRQAGVASFAISDILSKPIRTAEVAAAMRDLAPGASGTRRVMVIDDDPMALALMRQALADLGIDALCHGDGRAGLAALDTQCPDALILDLMMPGLDGFGVLDELHRLPQWRDLPVFIWTAMVLSDDEYARLCLSARAILSKGGGDLMTMLSRLRRWRPPASLAEIGG